MKKIAVFAVIFLISFLSKAQYSYFNYNEDFQLISNPAFTGSDSALVFSNFYSSPIAGSEAYSTYLISADNYFHRIRGGIGIRYMTKSSEESHQRMSSFHFNYAPHFELSNQWAIQAGLQLSYLTDSDPPPNFDGHKKSTLDYSSGVLFYNPFIYAGMAVHHITAPRLMKENYVIKEIPRQFMFQTGANWKLNHFTLSPGIEYLRLTTGYYRFVGELTGKYKWIAISACFEHNAQKRSFAGGTIGMQNSFFKINYGFTRDITPLPPAALCGNDTPLPSRPFFSHALRLVFFIPNRRSYKKISIRQIGNIFPF